MDNDNKVIKNDKAEVRLFLKDELSVIEKRHRTNLYNLEKEYAKTRKNKSYFIWSLMIACFVAVVLITTIVVRHLTVQNKKIEIDSNVFNDLDMSVLFSTRSHLQMEFIIAENTYNQLKNEFDYKLKKISNKQNAEIQILNALQTKDFKAQKNKIDNSYKNELENLHLEYDAKIEEARKNYIALKKQFEIADAYNSDSLNVADEVQEHERTFIVNSFKSTIRDFEDTLKNEQEIAFNSQKDSIKKLGNTINALDPIIKDDNAKEIVQTSKQYDFATFKVKTANEFLATLPQDILIYDFKQGFNKAGTLFEKYNYLHSKVDKIPQKNSIAEYKTSESKLVSGILSEICDAIYLQLEKLNNVINNLKNNVSSLNTDVKNLNQKIVDLNQEKENLQTEFQTERNNLETTIANQKEEYSILQLQYDGVSGNLSMFNSWFENLATTDDSIGYILDLKPSNKMNIFTIEKIRRGLLESSNPESQKSLNVNVLRGKRKKISSGSISQENGCFYFEPSDIQTSSLIQPGDRLVISEE